MISGVSKGVPQLRFCDFDGTWEVQRLVKKVKSISSGNVKPTSQGKYPVYGSTGIIGKSEICSNSGQYLLCARVGARAGTLQYAEGDFSVTDNTLIIGCDEGLDVQFLHSVLIKYNLSRLLFGTGQPLITGGQLKSLKLGFPALPEQQKIAAFLSAVDQKIQLLQRKKELLEQYKKGVMQKLFSQEIRFKDEDGNDYPDWEQTILGDIADRIAEKNRSNKYKVVLTNSATQGIVNQRDFFDKDIANQNNLEGYYIVSEDDFVYNPRISKYAPVGPIKRNKLARGIMSPLYSVFRFRDSVQEYFEYYFETTLWYHYLKKVANYGARHDRMNITNSDFMNMPLRVPSSEEMGRIITFIGGVSKKLKHSDEQLSKMQDFKKGLLQQMFV